MQSNFYCLSTSISFIGMFGNVTYSLVGDHSMSFSIDSIAGLITVQNSSFLDRERLPEASFSALAMDKAPITTRHSAIVPVNILRNVIIWFLGFCTWKFYKLNLINYAFCTDPCYYSRCQRQQSHIYAEKLSCFSCRKCTSQSASSRFASERFGCGRWHFRWSKIRRHWKWQLTFPARSELGHFVSIAKSQRQKRSIQTKCWSSRWLRIRTERW